MLSPLRNRFGIPGVISVIALVFAMLGGAYAASSDNGGKATASAKAKKGPRGPKGATGPAGPAGPAGPQGPAGANGKDGAAGAAGKEGAKGKDGTNGAPGKSITATSLSVGDPECEEGGVSLEEEGSGTPIPICNGEDGKEGSPWTAGGTLPKGTTMTGAWAFSGNLQTVTTEVEGVKEEVAVGSTEAWAAISLPIPLTSNFSNASKKTHYSTEVNFTDFDGEGPETVGCLGNSDNPKAPEGHLCVYEGGTSEATFVDIRQGSGAKGFGRTGGFVKFAVTGPNAIGSGTWAVTGF
jgi:hypothetical protein